MSATVSPVTSPAETLARNLRQRRVQRNLSLSELARLATLSKSTVSEIERGAANPAIETLWSLAMALKVPLAALFDDGADGEIRVTRFEDAAIIAGGEAEGMLIRHLRSRHGRGDLELYVMEFVSTTMHNAPAHGPGQIEHIIVLSGKFDIGPDGASAVLSPGDCMTFPADRPHHYYALEAPARLIGIEDYPG
jgi:transcriptional regulator with XRE-family HTH domain